jgi:hypothetical protein
MSDQSFEEWVEEYPKRKELVEVLRENNGGPLSPEFKEYLVNNSDRHAQQFEATKNWLERIRGLCYRIQDEVAANAEYALFWIYLHGVVHELYKKEDQTREVATLIPWRKPFIEALDALRDCFNEDELSFIRFMRHNHVHILVDYPWQKIQTEDGEVVNIQEAHDPDAVANAKRILKDYNNDQHAAATDFAEKAVDEVEAVHDAFREATAL